MQRNSIDKALIQIQRAQLRCIGEAMKRLVREVFLLVEESHHSEHRLLVENPGWPEDHQPQVLVEENVWWELPCHFKRKERSREPAPTECAVESLGDKPLRKLPSAHPSRRHWRRKPAREDRSCFPRLS